MYENKIEVRSIQGFSAHAGQDLLLDYAMSQEDAVKQICLVHGEKRGAYPLMDLLREKGYQNVYFPKRNDMLEI